MNIPMLPNRLKVSEILHELNERVDKLTADVESHLSKSRVKSEEMRVLMEENRALKQENRELMKGRG